MTERMNENKIRKALSQRSAVPSEEWEQMMLAELADLSAQDVLVDHEMGESFFQRIFLNPSGMFKKSFVAIAFTVFLAFAGFVYFNGSQVGEARQHLANANGLLSELRQYVDTGQVAMDDNSLFLVAYAEQDDELLLVDLVAEFESEVDTAIELVEGFDDLAAQKEVLEEVYLVQDDAVEVLSDVLASVENEEVSEAISDVIFSTVEKNVEVKQSVNLLIKAEEDPELKALVKIKTSFDAKPENDSNNKEAKKQMRIDFALETIGSVNEAELTDSLKEKFDTINEILLACENAEEKCNSGKAKGLSVALKAKLESKSEDELIDEDEGDDDEGDDDESDEEGESVHSKSKVKFKENGEGESEGGEIEIEIEVESESELELDSDSGSDEVDKDKGKKVKDEDKGEKDDDGDSIEDEGEDD